MVLVRRINTQTAQFKPATRTSFPVSINQFADQFVPDSTRMVAPKSTKAVGTALRKRVQMSAVTHFNEEYLSPFFVCDIGELKRLVRDWHRELPRIQPFYAIKCNSTIPFLRAISDLDLGFDCASKNEVAEVLLQGVDPDRIIFANPCKAIPHISYAKANGINLTTVDNEDELLKIKRFHPDCGVLIRIMTDDSNSSCPLSVKFGASIEYSKILISNCKQLDLNLKGIAFHVGSGCTDWQALNKAIKDSRTLFDFAQSKGIALDILDIGGGFSKDSFPVSSWVVQSAIDTYFPDPEFGHVKMMAELGRYLASTCFTLATNITSRRADPIKERLYVNDGIYGSMNCTLYDHQKIEPRVLTSEGEFCFFQDIAGPTSTSKKYSVWGPTCDGLDCISTDCTLSKTVMIGDWLYFCNMGAYTMAAASGFNGFQPTSQCYYVDSEE